MELTEKDVRCIARRRYWETRNRQLIIMFAAIYGGFIGFMALGAFHNDLWTIAVIPILGYATIQMIQWHKSIKAAQVELLKVWENEKGE